MRIENRPSDLQRAGSIKGPEGVKPETASRQSVAPLAGAARGDQVQISDAGRALAAQMERKDGPREALSPERISQIRQRILEGAYNSVEVVEEVAKRMLERGDI